MLWLSATGGAASPFFLLWGISIVAIAFRFGPQATRVATVAYLALDVGLLLTWDALVPLTPLVAVRLAYLTFFGMLGSFMASSNLDALNREEKLARTTAELEESEARMAAVMESAPSIIMRTDLSGRIEYINHTVLGVTREQVIGSSLYDFMPEDQRPVLETAFRDVVRTGATACVELAGQGPGGGLAWYQTYLGPVRHGPTTTGVLLLTMDITRQREQEAAARRVQEQDEEMERLKERDEFRRQLLNSVAHELNTPLTPLKLQLVLLGKRLGGDVDLKMLTRNLDRLERLVGDLLEVARLDNGKFHIDPQEHDLVAVVQEAIETFQPGAAERGVVLQAATQGRLLVHADRMRLTQVLYNLLFNAIKYSPEGGIVVVEARRDDGCVECAVRDKGPGFTDGQKQSLFQPFESVHPPPRPEDQSTGLGLYITKGIIEAHGGEVHVESEGPGKGSTFLFRLPSGTA